MEKVTGIIQILGCEDSPIYQSLLDSLNRYKRTKEIVERTQVAMGKRTIVDFSKTQVTNIKTNVRSTTASPRACTSPNYRTSKGTA